jgi:hypothetical protein
MFHHLFTTLLLTTLISDLPLTIVLNLCGGDQFHLTYLPTHPSIYSAIPTNCTFLFPDHNAAVSLPLTNTTIFSINRADGKPPVLVGAVFSVTRGVYAGVWHWERGRG